MTGGCVVILGKTGKNFAAGMSGGIAYVLDQNNELYLSVNKEMIAMSAVTDSKDVTSLKALIMAHTDATGSMLGKTILKNFDEYLPKIKKIIPNDYKLMITEIERKMNEGYTREQAEIEVFNTVHKA